MSQNSEDEECVYKVKNRAQVELLTDPLGIPILVAMERDHWITAYELAEELGEKEDLIYNYLQNMYKTDMLLKKEENNKEKFCKKATFYSVGKMFSDLPETIDDHWIFGIIQHLKGDFKDMLELLQESKSLTEGFENSGYPGDKSLDFLIRKLHLDKEQIDDFNQELRNLINKYNNKDTKSKEVYDITIFRKPYLPSMINESKTD